MLYGTFWYQLIDEGSLNTNRVVPTRYLGSLIFLFALVPAAGLILGAGGVGYQWVRRRQASLGPPGAFGAVAIALFGANLLLVLFVEVRTDVWSVMQARLLYPGLVGALLMFGTGVTLVQRNQRLRGLVDGAMLGLGIAYVVYLAAEVAAFVALR